MGTQNKRKTELLEEYKRLRQDVPNPTVHDICAVIRMTARRLASLSGLPIGTVQEELYGLQTSDHAHEAMVMAFLQYGCHDASLEGITWGSRNSLPPGRPTIADLCERLGWTLSTLQQQGGFSQQALYNEYSGDYLSPRIQKHILQLFQNAGINIQSVYDINWDPRSQRPVTRKGSKRISVLIAFPPELLEHIERQKGKKGYQWYFDALAQQNGIAQISFQHNQSPGSSTWRRVRFGIFPEVEQMIREARLTRQDFFETLVRRDMENAVAIDLSRKI